MEPVIINLGKGKNEHYDDLLDKYLGYSFSTADEEQEFIGHIKSLISENEEEIEFEAKVWILNHLVSGVKLKKYGIDYLLGDSK